MIIIAYICTILNYILYCSSRFMKEKKKMLLVDIGAKILTIISLYLLGSMSGAYIFIIMMFSLFLASIKEKKGEKWIPVYVIIELLFIAILIFQYEGISSILIFISASLNFTSNWFLKPQEMQKVGMVVSIIYLTYQISIKNIAGMLEIFVLLSNILSYCKYKNK